MAPSKLTLNPPSHALTPVPSAILDSIHAGDCIERLEALPDGCVQLVFADPPFNIGYEYDVYDDRVEHVQYLDWCRQWISQIQRVLIPTGTFWLAIGDEYAAELKVMSQECGFHCRSWVVWYYTFGVHCLAKFTRSHAHLFHFVKDPNRFTFHAEEIAVPSARQLVYADARANPKGRMPDDTWILRPQDCIDGLTPNEDTWYFPRVNGTFKERAGFHGCQMPEQLLGRILRACSNAGDVVLDPFSGSATTVAVAKKLGRHFVGFDLSPEYVALGNERLQRITPGDPLVGAADPKQSAPSTREGKRRGESRAHVVSEQRARKVRSDPSHTPLLPFREEASSSAARRLDAVQESWRHASLDRLILDPILNEDFQRACDRREIPGSAAQRNRCVLRLRRAGRFHGWHGEIRQRVTLDWQQAQSWIHASEIAWRHLSDLYAADLDEIFCDPRLAAAFDHIAQRQAPDLLPLHLRWGALMARDAIRASEKQLENASEKSLELGGWKKATTLDWATIDLNSIPAKGAIYALERARGAETLFIAEAPSLRDRLRSHLSEGRLASGFGVPIEDLRVRYTLLPTNVAVPWVRRTWLLQQSPTPWNVLSASLAPSLENEE